METAISQGEHTTAGLFESLSVKIYLFYNICAHVVEVVSVRVVDQTHIFDGLSANVGFELEENNMGDRHIR